MLIYADINLDIYRRGGEVIQKSKMAAGRWLPNIERFFASMENDLLQSIRVCSNNCDGESSDYWLARLENLEEVLSLFYARVHEGGSTTSTERLLELITDLREDVRTLRIQFSRTALYTTELDEPNNLNVLTPSRTPLEYSGEVGRPNFRRAVTESQLRFLHEDLGLRWVDIARCLGVSERTLRRWRCNLGFSLSRNFTSLTNDELDVHVRDVLQNTPSVGLSLMRGALRNRGLNIQRERVRQSMNRVDPLSRTVHHTQFITRRVYNVRSPNSLWYVYYSESLNHSYILLIFGIEPNVS